METADLPAAGDVLVTSERGRHLLSVVPHPHRLSLSNYAHALEIARRWAADHNVAVWTSNGSGVFTKVSNE